MGQTRSVTDEAVAAVFREEAGRLTGALVRVLGNFDLAEEVVQDSLVAALEKWPEQGIPDNPGAWLMTTARRRAIDLLRRDRRCVPNIRGHDGSAHRARQTQDRGRAHPVSRAAGP